MSRLTLATNATESKPVRSFGFIQPTESAVCVACKVQSRRVQFILVHRNINEVQSFLYMHAMAYKVTLRLSTNL